MDNAVWKTRVDTALSRLDRDRWTAPAVPDMEIVEPVASGRRPPPPIARRAGSPDLVAKALDRVTRALLGDDAAPRLDEGGWYENDGERYRVAPDFAAEWLTARDAQRRMQARQAI